ncbi:MAG TPA: PilZ domain-containing protein [Stellaceae bacterium]
MSDRPTSEQRRHERQSGLWSAHLETTSGQRLHCLLFDVSQGGARLRVDEPVAVDDILTLVSRRFGTRGVRIVWTGPRQAGIRFLSDARLAPAASLDPDFLRGRAELLRRLAEAGESGVRLAHLADAFERKARTIEKRQLTPPLSIRKDRRPAPIDQ